MPRLRELYLSDTTIGDAGVKNLEELPELQELYLRGTGITDSGLRHLSRFSKLRALDLSDTEITDEGLECLSALPELTYLSLSGTAVGDAGMVHLEQLANLAYLDLLDTHVTVGWIRSHVREFPERGFYGFESAYGWVRSQGGPVMLGWFRLDFTLQNASLDGPVTAIYNINNAIRAALMSLKPEDRISLRSQGIR